jgi:hypothetical protein
MIEARLSSLLLHLQLRPAFVFQSSEQKTTTTQAIREGIRRPVAEEIFAVNSDLFLGSSEWRNALATSQVLFCQIFTFVLNEVPSFAF